MREFTKSLLSFSWAMSLFGAQQMVNLFRRPAAGEPRGRATAAMDAVTAATEEQFDDVLRETFKAGDRLQKGLVDMLARMLTLGGMGMNRAAVRPADAAPPPGAWPAPGAAATGWGSPQPGTGWGPMPPPGDAEGRGCCG
jgi:hypothetical protein